jgi:recombination DNA repair RAD52 pathway protein
MVFDPKQVDELGKKLNGDNVSERKQAGRTFSYIEGWHAISEANRIFGFGYWDHQTLDMVMIAEEPTVIGGKGNKRGYEGWRVSYRARSQVNVRPQKPMIVSAQDPIVLKEQLCRQGWGFGQGIDRDLGLAHESALKEAATDALKRALISFGSPFGLALYDKSHDEVDYEGSAENDVRADTRRDEAGYDREAINDSRPSDVVARVEIGAMETALKTAPDLEELARRWSEVPQRLQPQLQALKDAMKFSFKKGK